MNNGVITNIQHVSLLVADLRRSIDFYRAILGLQPDPARPDLGFEGAWLTVGATQQVHLLQLSNPDPVSGRPEHAGRDRHTAFHVQGLEVIEQRLQRDAIAFTRSRSGRRAIFFRDPDGNGIELIESAS